MRLTFSGVGLTNLYGGFGAETITRNAYGPYARRKSTPPAPNAFLIAWQAVQAALEFDWSNTLTDDDRAEWLKFSLARKNRLAKSIRITGHEAYMSVNLNLKLIGGGGTVLPPVYSPVSQLEGLSFNDLSPLHVKLDIGVFDVSTTSLAVYFTPNISAGRMSVNQVYAFTTVETSPGLGKEFFLAYVARLTGITPGKKVFAKVQPINKITGARGIALYASMIATP